MRWNIPKYERETDCKYLDFLYFINLLRVINKINIIVVIQKTKELIINDGEADFVYHNFCSFRYE